MHSTDKNSFLLKVTEIIARIAVWETDVPIVETMRIRKHIPMKTFPSGS